MPERAVSRGHWEHYAHDADVGVRGHGNSKAEAFRQAALAMMALVVEAETVQPRIKVPISCQAPDDVVLLIDWLNAVILEMAADGLVFGDFSVETSNGALSAQASGEPVERSRHAVGVELKGATFTDAAVWQDPETGAWTAQCIVDV
ncbi:MAG: archease [Alphaproteobacteria bacterium]|nr:archease [Alphaproteobacteria bacterium]